jgi:hypothetical protein
VASPPPKKQGKKVFVAPGAPKKAPRPPAPLEVKICTAERCFPKPPAPLEVKPTESAVDSEALLAAIMARGGLIDGDPEMAAMDVPDVYWGDLCQGSDRVFTAPAERPLRGTLDELWSQPFATNLEIYTMDVYNTSRLTDEEWNAMMSWLYWKGWWVDNADRGWVSAETDDLPARYWCPRWTEEPEPIVDDFRPRKVVCWDEAAVTVQKEPKKKALRASGMTPVPVMRFCRAVGTCTEAGCRYVHGDTIPKMDKPCGFGAECGASDPTGVKRSQCIYMHPGEEWTADLCIHRP